MERCRRKYAARKGASLAEAECKMFTNLWPKIQSKFVNIVVNNEAQTIRTIYLNQGDDKTPLVLVHGMGAGVGFWAMNLESLSQHRPVYAFDLLGFGRSSRPKFSNDATEAENQFVDSIEAWRKEMKLERFILLGHSLGGYLSTAYTIQHPEKVEHLILADPWGFQDPEAFQPGEYPTWVRVVAKAAGSLNPFALLRAAGPFGLKAVKRLRSDLLWKFSSVASEEDVAAYIYYCNSQTPSGEAGFKAMNLNLGWAKNPMIRRLPDLVADLPLTFITGAESWIDNSTAFEAKHIHNKTNIHIIQRAGHHVYADGAAKFNDIVNRVCQQVDDQENHIEPNSEPCKRPEPSKFDLASSVLGQKRSGVSRFSRFSRSRTPTSVPDFKQLTKSEETLPQS